MDKLFPTVFSISITGAFVLPSGNYSKATGYYDFDTDNQIALLIETICSEPKQASNPGAYIEAHSIEFGSLSIMAGIRWTTVLSYLSRVGRPDLRGILWPPLAEIS